jgi:hypothetical protein
MRSVACAVSCWMPLTSPDDFGGGRAGTFGQLAHLIGDDGETAALFSGPRGFDRRVERQQIGLIGDFADQTDDAADPLGPFAQCIDAVCRVLQARRVAIQAGRDDTAALGRLRYPGCRVGGALGFAGDDAGQRCKRCPETLEGAGISRQIGQQPGVEAALRADVLVGSLQFGPFAFEALDIHPQRADVLPQAFSLIRQSVELHLPHPAQNSHRSLACFY